MAKKNKKNIGFMGKFLGVSALIVLIAVGVQSGSMKGLNGRNLVDIEPAAGEKIHEHEVLNDERNETYKGHADDEEHRYKKQGREVYDPDHGHAHIEYDWGYDVPPEPTECGVYEHWVAHPVDEDAIKETGKVYRIIGLGDAVTEDFNPERINVYLNKDDLVLDVKCG